MKKRVCIIYTGGTIGMVPSENGYIPSSHGFKENLGMINDLSKPNMPEIDVIEFDPLLDSSNISIREWNMMGKTIADNYDKYDGFVVLHGTDTMSYSASALAFMLENLNKPVVFTGAQIPLCQVRSDGYNNIVAAVVIASEGITNEVCIYFDGKLLRGCRSTKISSDQFAAFSSPNFEVLADVGITVDYKHPGGNPKPDGGFKFVELKEVPVGIIKMFPGIQIKLFESIMTRELKGVVLETFGAGNIPSASTGELIPIISKAYENGTLIVVCSQCIQGTVSLGTYETSKSLRDIGALTGQDMTTEAAMTKMIYLFSKYDDVDNIRELLITNIRGEMN